MHRSKPPQPDHPRIRGEHDGDVDAAVVAFGSSPHTRGARPRGRASFSPPGIIPAYAGSTVRPRKSWCQRPDHPRIRGEHGHRLVRRLLPPGSSPHTRGAPRQRRPDRPDRRIIPAYAGSTRRRTAPGWKRRDHPRIRGEHVHRGLLLRHGAGSSPHTRGAQGDGRRPRRGVGIIPAYAGST